MTIFSLLQKAKKEISSLDAEILLSFVLQKNRSFLFAHLEENIEKNSIILDFFSAVERRKNGEPIDHILGVREFYGLEFFINKNVLSPRPETEFLVDKALKIIEEKKVQNIFDIGTGSGCIAISVAKNLPLHFLGEIIAIDISIEALDIAKKNRKKYSLEEKIEFRESDLFSAISHEEIQNSLILANLPYIPETDSLEKEVYDFDPHLALFSGSHGLFAYRKFFTEIPDTFAGVLFEFHPPQKESLEKIILKNLPQKNISFFEDLSGQLRFGYVS